MTTPAVTTTSKEWMEMLCCGKSLVWSMWTMSSDELKGEDDNDDQPEEVGVGGIE
jgi:hypothetical protein